MRDPRISGSYVGAQYSYLNNFLTQIAGACNMYAYKGLTYTSNTVSLIVFAPKKPGDARCTQVNELHRRAAVSKTID